MKFAHFTGILIGILSAVNASGKPNIVIVTADTLRADHLSCYGYPHDISPSIDELARKGTLFEDAVTVIGKTCPAFVSLFTSRFPPETGARRNGIRMRQDMATLAEILKREGYRTGAIVSNWTLRDKLCGLKRGFDYYDESFTRHRHTLMRKEKPAEIVTRNAVEILGRLSSDDFFLWVHYSDPHSPYRFHSDFLLPGFSPFEKSSGWERRRNYASEVHYMDHWIGVFLEKLTRTNGLDDTFVFFLSDHGESLGEHHYWGHGQNVFQPTLRIPLIVSGPGWAEGKRTTYPISIIDVMPTILKVLGISIPTTLQGRPLQWIRDGEVAASRPRYAFSNRGVVLVKHAPEKSNEDPLSMCMISDGIKLIYDFRTDAHIWFNLSTDPGEMHARIPASDPEILRMQKALICWYMALPKYSGGSDAEFSDDDIRQLQSLGYIEN
ncbi:sulfatase [bacterium]|nr:sulfatase [candidate division CSSED10-310 bacterium]